MDKRRGGVAISVAEKDTGPPQGKKRKRREKAKSENQSHVGTRKDRSRKPYGET